MKRLAAALHLLILAFTAGTLTILLLPFYLFRRSLDDQLEDERSGFPDGRSPYRNGHSGVQKIR